MITNQKRLQSAACKVCHYKDLYLYLGSNMEHWYFKELGSKMSLFSETLGGWNIFSPEAEVCVLWFFWWVVWYKEVNLFPQILTKCLKIDHKETKQPFSKMVHYNRSELDVGLSLGASSTLEYPSWGSIPYEELMVCNHHPKVQGPPEQSKSHSLRLVSHL